MKRMLTVLATVPIFSMTPASAGPPLEIVETYTYSGTITANLPGTTAGGGTQFSGSLLLNSLDFTPGSVVFAGQPIDFDGTEADFIGATCTHDSEVPTTFGPATVDVIGTVIISGAAVNTSGNLAATDIPLGALFSPNSLDVTPGGNPSFSGSAMWSSTVIPELNGRDVIVDGTTTINAVDAANGLVDVVGSGSLSVVLAVGEIPTLSGWGLALLAAALLASGLFLRLRGLPIR